MSRITDHVAVLDDNETELTASEGIRRIEKGQTHGVISVPCGGWSEANPEVKCLALLRYTPPQQDAITREHWRQRAYEALAAGDRRAAGAYFGHLGRDAYFAHPQGSNPCDCVNRTRRLSASAALSRGPRTGPVIPTLIVDDVARMLGYEVRPRYEDGLHFADHRIDGVKMELVDTNPPSLAKADLNFLMVDQQSNANAIIGSLDAENAARMQYALDKIAAGELVREPVYSSAVRAQRGRDIDTLEGLAVVWHDAIRPSLAHRANATGLHSQQRGVLMPGGILTAQQYEGWFSPVSARDASYGSVQRVVGCAAVEAERQRVLRVPG